MMKNLSLRERQYLIGGGVALLSLLLIFGFILPLTEMLSGMDARFINNQGAG